MDDLDEDLLLDEADDLDVLDDFLEAEEVRDTDLDFCILCLGLVREPNAALCEAEAGACFRRWRWRTTTLRWSRSRS